MGKLIKHQWARLIALTAGACTQPYSCLRDHINRIDLSWAAVWGFFFPKAFFDMFTPYTSLPKFPSSCSRVFNVLVAPVPVVQLINLLAGFAVLCLEWPLPWLKETPVYRAFALRFAAYPIIALFALLQYQATNAAFYLLIATAYFLLSFLAMWANGKDLCPSLVRERGYWGYKYVAATRHWESVTWFWRDRIRFTSAANLHDHAHNMR